MAGSCLLHRSSVTVTVILLLSLAMALPGALPSSRAGPSYSPRAAILINGNAGFIKENGVTGGSGIAADPYIISGWDIAGQNTAIEISYTDAFFVIRNVFIHSNDFGVRLVGVSHGRVESSLFDREGWGVDLRGSSGIIIANNNMTATEWAISVSSDISTSIGSSNVTIVGNSISNGENGISGGANPISPGLFGMNVTKNRIWSNVAIGIDVGAGNSVVALNNVTSNGLGLSLGPGLAKGNYVARNVRGIVLVDVGSRLEENTLIHNGLEIHAPIKLSGLYDSHDIPSSNTIDGKPILYLKNCHDTTIDGQVAAEIIVGSCDNLRLENLKLENSYAPAIQMGFVHNATVTNTDFTNDTGGLQIEWSNNVTVVQNRFLPNNDAVLLIHDTGNLTIQKNSFTSNRGVSVLSGISHLVIVNNTLSENELTVSDSSPILLAYNVVRANTGIGIQLNGVAETTILRNIVGENGEGVEVTSANGLNVTENNFLYNGVGLDLSAGGVAGAPIFNTVVYHNNFVYNGDGAGHDYNVVPMWDDGYPIGGNFWTDFNGTDNCSGPSQNICNGPDGIGDKPYTGLLEWFPSGTGRVRGPSALEDHYPLMKPFGDFSWDLSPPTWPAGAFLTFTTHSFTTVTLQWTAATDDSWVQAYRLYGNGTLLAELPGNVYSYELKDISSSASYTFKVEAGDVANNWSTTGPSMSLAPQPTNNNPPGENKPTNGASHPTGLLDLVASELAGNYPYVFLAGIGAAAVAITTFSRRSKRDRKENSV